MNNDSFYPTRYQTRRQVVRPTSDRRQAGDRRHNFVGLAGQADHQDALRFVLDTRGRSAFARLVPEPENPQDPHAVAVTIDGRNVGYLSPDVAEKYGPVLLAKSEQLTVPADLRGGEWDRPSIGVVLDFSLVYAAARQH